MIRKLAAPAAAVLLAAMVAAGMGAAASAATRASARTPGTWTIIRIQSDCQHAGGCGYSLETICADVTYIAATEHAWGCQAEPGPGITYRRVPRSFHAPVFLFLTLGSTAPGGGGFTLEDVCYQLDKAGHAEGLYQCEAMQEPGF